MQQQGRTTVVIAALKSAESPICIGSLSPILAAWLLGAPAAAETQTAARPGRVTSGAQMNSRVLRKQTGR